MSSEPTTPTIPTIPTFTLALSLSGGASTGAYIAGVVDFIVEALDAFEEAKQRGDAGGPTHAVVVNGICGASAGSLVAAALGLAMRHDFPHVRAETPDDEASANPLFDSWVNLTSAEKLLDTADRGTSTFASLLDATALDAATEKIIDFGQRVPTIDRRWVADPIRIAFTVTNLSGVPFCFGPRHEQHLTMRMHADALRFAISKAGCGSSAPPPMPDERHLRFPDDPMARDRVAWSGFAHASVASAAFPALLPPRQIERPISDYRHIRIVLPGSPDRAAEVVTLVPAADFMKDGTGHVRFVTSDGGTLDNHPCDLARETLNGRDLLQATPRDSDDTLRAVLMVDPLTDDGSIEPDEAATAWNGLRGLVTAVLDQASFRPVEIALAQQPLTYTRFLIAPLREGPYGSESGRCIAGASCKAFGGYLSRTFREHDFLLGRQNAQRYLAEQLTLRATHPLFDGWRDREKHLVVNDGVAELPIIPLMGRLHPTERREPIPPWPKGVADVDALAPLIAARLDLIWDRSIGAASLKNWVLRALRLVGRLLWTVIGRRLATRAIVQWLRAGLRRHELES